MHYIKIKIIFKRKKLSRKTNLKDNIKFYIKFTLNLLSLTFLNNNDNKLTTQTNYIRLTHFN